ncbi:MAG: BRO-N domain-containing protein, partial [Acidithiobacillus sp.]
SLDDDEKKALSITEGFIEQGFSDAPIGTTINLINEPGLYRLILTSRKPEAKAFKRWVTHEVLPQIRKTGKYTLPNTSHPTQGAALKLPKGVTWAKLASAHRAFFRMADDAGFRGPERIAAVHRAVVRTCGVDISGLFAPLTDQPTASPADEVRPALSSAEPATVEVVVPPDAELRPTDLGGLLGGLTAQRMNQTLYALGYQTPQSVRGQPDWKATAKGAPFAVQKYVPKANGIGGSVPQLFWKANILKDLRSAIDPQSAGFQRASDDKGGQVPLLNS